MIIQIGTDFDESRILWKHKESDEWKRADIDDLIEAYENRQKGEWIDCTEDGYVELPFCHSATTEEQTMRLIKLTSIEKRDIAIVADEVISIERGDYFGGDYIDWESEKTCDFKGRPTRIIMKNFNYAVREDFETVCALVEGANDE